MAANMSEPVRIDDRIVVEKDHEPTKPLRHLQTRRRCFASFKDHMFDVPLVIKDLKHHRVSIGIHRATLPFVRKASLNAIELGRHGRFFENAAR